MLLYWGLGIIVVGLLSLLVILWCGRIQSGRLFFAAGGTIVMIGVVVTQLLDIQRLVFKQGEKEAFSFELQRVERAAQQTQADAAEVKQMKAQIEELVKQVEQEKQNVSRMYGAMRQTWHSLFESFAYIVGTSNLTPLPDSLAKEIDRHLAIIATFAYPDPQERGKAVQRVRGNLQKVQKEVAGQ